MKNQNPTLKTIFESLNQNSLLEFQNDLRKKGIPQVFASFLPNPKDAANLEEFPEQAKIENCQLLLVRIWSPFAEDEKISGYIVDESLDIPIEELRLTSRTLFEIIGRNNTLSERIAFLENNDGPLVCQLKLANEKNKKCFTFRRKKDVVTISFSDKLKNILRKEIKISSDYAKFSKKVSELSEEAMFPMFARYLRRNYINGRENFLLKNRQDALAKIIQDDCLPALNNAVSFFEKGGKVDLAHNFDLYLDFISVIQASILFAPWFGHAVCIQQKINEEKSICIVCIGQNEIDLNQKGIEDIKKTGGSFFSEVVDIQDSLSKTQTEDLDDLQTNIISSNLAEPSQDIKESLKKLLAVNDDDDFFRRSQQFQNLLKEVVRKVRTVKKERKLAIAKILYSLGEVSRLLHEGVLCRFNIILGSGNSWRLFNETISREDEREYTLPLSTILKANYSIFQEPRIAAFIDLNVYPKAELISYLGRLVEIPEESWIRQKTSSSEYEDLYFFSSLGDGAVRLYGNGQLIAKWLHDSGRLLTNVTTISPNDIKTILKELKEPAVDELCEALMQIEETPGEGALIVFSDTADAHTSPMEVEELEMNWAKITNLEYANSLILRFLLRRDGASIVDKKGNLKLRRLIYPIDTSENKAIQLDKDERKKLIGKGSRHYSASCLQKVLSKEDLILALSVDGGIKEWKGTKEQKDKG